MSVAIEPVVNLDPQTLARFDAVVDVRSPSEYAEDHLPGAVNLPVLDDAERAEVGTLYVQTSHFLARRVGAAKISRNIAWHLESALAGKPADFRPLLYCWRGGMRSGAMATVLARVGWRVGVVEGGYRTWRRLVVDALRKSDARLDLILIDGQTGAAKTAMLRRLDTLGVQTLDLEALADHRGSVFGAASSVVQPSQKLFESRLFAQLQTLDAARLIVVEAESIRIGACAIPRRLWLSMLAAPRVELEASPAVRARYLAKEYAAIAADKPLLLSQIERLKPFHSRDTIDDWRALALAGDAEALAHALLSRHYDPLYDRARTRRNDVALARFRLDVTDDASLAETAVTLSRFFAQPIRQK